MWWEIVGNFAGAEDERRTAYSEEDKDREFKEVHDLYQREDSLEYDWQIYVLSHYCDPNEECTCRQYDTDHHPTAEYKGWVEL